MFITAIMVVIALIATFLIYDIKVRGNVINRSEFAALSAEELLEVIAGVPLKELLVAGDKVEIVIRTNDHPIASAQYVTQDLNGEVKLTCASDPVDIDGLQGASA